MLRLTSYSPRLLAIAGALALPAAVLAQADNRPVVVVFQFENSSIGAGAADFAGVKTGVQDLLITDLASNTKIRLVDRTHLAEVMTEQKMTRDQQVDPATAVRLGRVLGAQYAVTGGFMSDGKGNVVLTGRTIDIETTQIANPQKITGRADNVLGVIGELSTKLSGGMNLAPKPGAGARRGEAGSDAEKKVGQAGATTGKPSTMALYAKPLDKPTSMKVSLDAPALKLYSAALDAMDRNNNAAAIKLLTQVKEKFPGFEPAERYLKKLGA